MDLGTYRQSPQEHLRTNDLIRLLPKTRGRVLEIGSREGYHTQLLADLFDDVVAVDLSPRKLNHDRVHVAKASVTNLPFPDRTFDCILCSEVLEHVPQLTEAAREISRVARDTVLIGVPFRQDRRAGKLSCSNCGKVNPAYGHVNEFTEQTLQQLFGELEPMQTSLVGSHRDRTNIISSWLMTQAGNPWGRYDQDEPCIYCGRPFKAPPQPNLLRRALASASYRLDAVQRAVIRPSPVWVHVLFRKSPGRSSE